MPESSVRIVSLGSARRAARRRNARPPPPVPWCARSPSAAARARRRRRAAAPRAPYPLVTTDVADQPLVLGLVADAHDAPGSVATDWSSSRSSTTCSSSASSTGRIAGKSSAFSVRFAVPPEHDAVAVRLDQRLEQHRGQRARAARAVRAATCAGRSPMISGASASSRSRSRAFSVARSSNTDSSGDRRRQVDDALLDPAGVGDQHEHQPGRGETGRVRGGAPASATATGTARPRRAG